MLASGFAKKLLDAGQGWRGPEAVQQCPNQPPALFLRIQPPIVSSSRRGTKDQAEHLLRLILQANKCQRVIMQYLRLLPTIAQFGMHEVVFVVQLTPDLTLSARS